MMSAFLMCTVIAEGAEGVPPATTLDTSTLAAVAQRSVLSVGEPVRLRQVMHRAEQGGAITVAVIGGSITQGAKASREDTRYGNRLAAWWRTTFPPARVRFVNAGVGATQSDYAAMRAQRDLISAQPDFVVVEFAVNDEDTREAAESLEGLVRQLLRQPNAPAVALLFMTNREGENAQAWFAKVGAHYDLPMVSFRDALMPEVRSGRLAWTTFEADEVHPNDLGHNYAAACVTTLLEQVRTGKPVPAGSVAATLPAPLLTDTFEFVRLHEAPSLVPIRNDGWYFDPLKFAWATREPGSAIEFEIEGSLVWASFYRIRGGMGRALTFVDGQPTGTLEAWFPETWGGYRASQRLAQHLAPGKHVVRFELSPDKAAASDGFEFRIMALGGGGVSPPPGGSGSADATAN